MVKAAICLLLLFLSQTAIADSLYDVDESTYDVDESNALIPLVRTKHEATAPAAHTNVELIDVRCDAKAGMIVTVEFEEIFSGIIYSQGYFSDPKCRYVKAGGNDRVYTFTVPYEGCGSKPSCSVCASVDNILVIQSDEGIQEVWDTARRITCSRSEVAEKTIYFKPFVVDMLEVVNVPTSTGGVECWMDIQVGAYPKISPIPGPIKIGETLSVLVYLKDDRNEYDLVVRDCWAYDNEDYGAKSTGRLQLSDGNGCSRKKKLFGRWTKTSSTGNSGATSILHNTLYAFKFPDKAQVFLKCDIEICRFGCDEPICEAEVEEKKRPRITTTKAATVRSRVTVTDAPLSRSPTRTVPLRTRPTARTTVYEDRTEVIPINSSTSRTRTRGPVGDRRVTQAPVTAESTVRPFRCYQGSDDPRCARTESTLVPEVEITSPRQRQRTRPTQAVREQTRGRVRTTTEAPIYLPPETTTQFSCNDPENYNNPLCAKPSPTTRVPVRTRPTAQSTTRFSCDNPENANNPRCFRTTTQRITETVRQRTRPPNTRPPVSSVASSTRGRSRFTTQPPTYLPPETVTEFSCANPQNRNDPRCQPTTVIPSTTAFVCQPGSTDPRCPPDCYPGNRDPRCPQIQTSTRTPSTTRRIETTTQFVCRPGSTDPRCPPDCYPGNRDPRCPQISSTTTRKTNVGITRPSTSRVEYTTQPATYLPPEEVTTQRQTRPTVTTQRQTRPTVTTQRQTRPTATTSQRIDTTTRFRCLLGSTDPRCPPECYPGSTDVRCPKPTQTTTRRVEYTTEPATYLPPVESQVTTPKPTRGPVGITKDIETTTKFVCRQGSIDPRCPADCYPGSSDPRCPKPTATPRQTTTRKVQTTPFVCQPGSTDARCPPDCYPGNRDPRCPKVTSTQRPYSTTQRPFTTSVRVTTQPPTYLPPEVPVTQTSPRPSFTTTRTETTRFSCYPGSTDPRCPPDCYPGSRDPRCPQPTATTKKPFIGDTRPTTQRPVVTSTQFTCYPGSTDPRCPPNCASNPNDPRCPRTTQRPVTSTQFTCYPGSRDPRCPQTTQRPYSTTQRPVTSTPFSCYPGSRDPRCPQTTQRVTTQPPTYLPPETNIPVIQTTPRPSFSTTRKVETTTKFSCYPGSTDPRCPPNCVSNPNDPRCPRTTQRPVTTQRPFTTQRPATTQFSCLPGSTDPRCPPNCNSNPNDPRCPRTTQRPVTTTQFTCYPGSRDPRCPQTTQRPYSTTQRPVTSTPFSCYPGSRDPRCPQTTQRITTQPATYLPPETTVYQTTPRPSFSTTRRVETTTRFSCSPGSTDPRCPPNCNINPNDPRCPRTTQRPVTTQRPATTQFSCLPGSTDPRCPPNCASNPNDPRCPKPTQTTRKPFIGDTRPTTQRPVVTSTQFSCYPGSTDPRCPVNCNSNPNDPRCPKTTQRPYSTTQRPVSSTPFSCYPGSRDPRCPQTTQRFTTQPPTYLPPETTVYQTTPKPSFTTTRKIETTTRFSCYPGSTDPRCPPNCASNPNDPRCPRTTQKPFTTTQRPISTQFSCYPGSTDPRCPPNCNSNPNDPRCPRTTQRPVTTTQFTCYPGSRDPRCPQTTQRPYSTTQRPVTSTPFSCYPGSRDPRCPQTTQRVTTQPPTYLPPETTVYQTTPRPSFSTTRRVETTTRFSCYPGSTDPRCPPNCNINPNDPRCPRTTQRPVTTQRPFTTQRPATTQFSCLPGSTDPRCPPNCNFNPNDPRCPKITTTKKPFIGNTKPSTQAPFTTQISCYPGSRDPRCPQPDRVTTQAPTYLPPDLPKQTTRAPYQNTTPRFTCTLGSTDPRCPKPFSTTPRPITTTQRLTTTQRPYQPPTSAVCYPGSPNPACPQPYRPSSTRPPSTYLPPFPEDYSAQSVRQSRQIDSELVESINDLVQPGASDFHAIDSSLSENQEENVDNDLYIRRKKRAAEGEEKEIISITLNFKGYQFA